MEHAVPARPKYYFIVKNGDDEDVVKTLQSIADQQFDPYRVTLMKCIPDPYDRKLYYDKMAQIIKPISLYSVVNDYYKNSSIDALLDMDKYRKSNYYIVVDAGKELPFDFLYKINRYMQYNRKFPFAITEDGVEMYDTQIHKKGLGNLGETLLNKIKETHESSVSYSFDM